MKNKNILGSVCIILSAILFGMMPLFTKTAFAHGANAYTVAFGRFLSGSIFCLLTILLNKKVSFKIHKDEWLDMVKCSFFYAVTPILLYTSYQYINSGLATTLHFTYPIIVIFYMLLFFKKTPDRKQTICTLLCVSGILLLYQPSGNITLTGIVLAIISGFIYAGYIVFLPISKVKEFHPMIITFWISLLSAVEIGAFSFCTHQLILHLDGIAWLCMIMLGFSATYLALALFQIGLLYVGEIKASLLSTFEPLTSLVVGILVYNEIISLKEGMGICLILFAVLLLVFPGFQSK